ncbi:MAG: DUF1697 domain-containing protein [Bacteroidales bacterium]|nr:DUF1697 domain-containing protein [Bacteroidales bacterium]
MEKYLALLRGINVSGKNLIKMYELRELLKSNEFVEVQTYIQSGNIIFKHKKVSNSTLEIKINNLIRDFFQLQVPVIVKLHNELISAISSNPFPEVVEKDFNKLLLVFLKETPTAQNIKSLSAMSFTEEKFVIKENLIYLFFKNGSGKSKMNNNFLESKLKVQSTSRNWNTILKLDKLLANS